MPRWSVLGARSIRRRSRFTPTVVGVALGIAVLFSVLITNATIDEGFSRIFRRTEVPRVQIRPVGGHQSDLPASVIDTGAKLDGVIDAQNGTTVSFRREGGKPDETQWLYAGLYRNGSVKPPRHRPRGDDMVMKGREPAAGAMEIGLGDASARKLKAKMGSVVKLVGPTGPVRFTVVALNTRRDGKQSTTKAGGPRTRRSRVLPAAARS